MVSFGVLDAPPVCANALGVIIEQNKAVIPKTPNHRPAINVPSQSLTAHSLPQRISSQAAFISYLPPLEIRASVNSISFGLGEIVVMIYCWMSARIMKEVKLPSTEIPKRAFNGLGWNHSREIAMQRLKVFQNKLQFISWFFGLATAPFIGIKRKIENGDHPYNLSAWSEESSAPPFATEWLEADQAIQLQGQLCLNLLQRSLMEYLDETVRLSSFEPPQKKNNWFKSFKKWFLDAGVDWNASGADLSLIEELTLARNRIQHGSDFDSHSLLKQQDEDYRARFPDALFQDDYEAQVFSDFGPQLRHLELTKDKLNTAIEEMMRFTNFIEEHLPVTMKSWHG
jgi:hypothetical protein